MVGVLTQQKQRTRNLAAVIAVALMLLWPAFVNGEPFYMPDTPSYLRGADGAIHQLTGASSAWSGELQKRFPTASDSDPARVATSSQSGAPASPSGWIAKASPEPEVVLKGRSIYYGAFLYIAQWLGNFWAMAFFQALLCAVAIMLTVARLRDSFGRKTTPTTIAGVGLGVAALTPLGFFASYLLPDVLGGLGLLAIGHILFFWERTTHLSRVFWFALLALAVISHTANVMLVAVLATGAVLGLAFGMPASRQGLTTVASALVIGLICQLIFSWGVKYTTGEAPIRPPFLAARIIEDGPGYDYLREHCPEARLIYCRTLTFRQRDSDRLLWSTDPSEGIFQALGPHDQRQAADEQSRFVLAVLKYRPLDFLGSSLRAFFSQITYFSLESFNYTRANIHYFEKKLPSPFLEHARQSRAYQNTMPVAFTEWATLLSVLASLAAIVWAVRTSYRREKRLTPAASFLILLVAGILMNAAICGALSTPRGRYQMRLIWVLPLAAMATCRVRFGRAGELEDVAAAPAGTAAAG